MLESVSFDQLRMFVAAADEGSFSAAARRVQRTQSAVSEAILNLEAHLGVVLFDRAGRYPKLTTEGVILLADARTVITDVDAMKARAKGIAGGLEAELTAVVDVFLPIEAVAEFAQQFRLQFPATPLRLYVEALGGAVQPVIDGRVSVGIVGSLPQLPPDLVKERVASIKFMFVAASNHPLASYRGAIPKEELARHVQLVLTDRSTLSQGREIGVMSASTWRLADLFAKHAFLLNGLGWGGMPYHTVANDIAAGRLVELAIEEAPPGGLPLPMFAAYRVAEPPGPAARWMIEFFKNCRGGDYANEIAQTAASRSA
ncbi:LysR family transcriptional regulator [Bradyrhizobium sp. Pha-3]|uniref:LysR family transcriptional regulator n=1 Tax=Bradyrhizobium sp. Pha-3 TaxID=208375 RepID=UPI0035D44484